MKKDGMTERIAEVERAYDLLLEERIGEVRDYVEARRPALRRHGLSGVGYQLPLRPRFFSREHLGQLEARVGIFWQGLLKVFHVAFGGELGRIAGLLQLEGPVRESLERYFVPERDFAQLFGRPDGFAWGSTVQFIEQNITSGPGGLAAIDALSHFFDRFPVVEALRERMAVERLAPLDRYASFFSSPEFAGKNIGYVDALDPKTGELWDDDGVRFLEALAEKGIHLLNLTGRKLELRDDGVYAEGQPLHFLYRGVAAIGLWFRLEELAPLFQACGRRQAEMILSPFEMVFFDKMLLPYLSDERLNTFLTVEERRQLAEILPWTRILREDATVYHGQPVRLPHLCLQQRERFVIKKGNGFGSEAVFMGPECTDAQWKAHVERGLNEGNWVVQEVVEPPLERLPYLDAGGTLLWADALSMACPYIIRGEVGGVAGRTSVPGGGRILVAAGAEGSQAGIRTACRVM